MALHRASRLRRARKHGIGGEVRHGVTTSGGSCETSLNRCVTPHLHREYGQLSKVQSGEMGPAPGRLELSAFWSEHMQWLRSSIWNVANWNYENWPQGGHRRDARMRAWVCMIWSSCKHVTLTSTLTATTANLLAWRMRKPIGAVLQACINRRPQTARIFWRLACQLVRHFWRKSLRQVVLDEWLPPT